MDFSRSSPFGVRGLAVSVIAATKGTSRTASQESTVSALIPPAHRYMFSRGPGYATCSRQPSQDGIHRTISRFATRPLWAESKELAIGKWKATEFCKNPPGTLPEPARDAAAIART